MLLIVLCLCCLRNAERLMVPVDVLAARRRTRELFPLLFDSLHVSLNFLFTPYAAGRPLRSSQHSCAPAVLWRVFPPSRAGRAWPQVTVLNPRVSAKFALLLIYLSCSALFGGTIFPRKIAARAQ